MQLDAQLFATFFKIGIGTIGGGYAMVPVMQHEIVSHHKWLEEEEFMDILAVSQSSPGVFAVNMSSYIGYKLGGIRSAIIATLANILPSFIIILGIAVLFGSLKQFPIVEAAFKGIRPVVVALIASPVFTMARSAQINRYNWWIPVVATALIYLLGVSPIYVILAAGIGGYLYGLYASKTK